MSLQSYSWKVSYKGQKSGTCDSEFLWFVSLDMCEDETAYSCATWPISLKLDFASQVTFMWLKIRKFFYVSDVAWCSIEIYSSLDFSAISAKSIYWAQTALKLQICVISFLRNGDKWKNCIQGFTLSGVLCLSFGIYYERDQLRPWSSRIIVPLSITKHLSTTKFYFWNWHCLPLSSLSSKSINSLLCPYFFCGKRNYINSINCMGKKL